MTQLIDVEAVGRLYRERLLEPYGPGVPAAYAAVGVALFVVAAPGVASFHAQNRYAQLGICLLVLLAAVALVAAGDSYRRLDMTRWKQTAERDGPRGEG